MRKDTKSLLLPIVVISIAFGFAWCCSHKTISSHRTYKQECRFGGISIDMDSVTAVNLLKNRWNEVQIKKNCTIPFKNEGDSIGYQNMGKCETFYLKFKDGKVYQIIFNSHLLKQNEIMIFDDTTPVKLDNKPFKKECDNFIFEYDGYYGFKVTKR